MPSLPSVAVISGSKIKKAAKKDYTDYRSLNKLKF